LAVLLVDLLLLAYAALLTLMLLGDVAAYFMGQLLAPGPSLYSPI
jgi:hypothetical protein